MSTCAARGERVREATEHEHEHEAEVSTVARETSAGTRDEEVLTGEELVAAMDTAARALLGRKDVDQTAEQIVIAAVAAIPPATSAGISLIESDHTVRALAPSTPLVEDLDRLQSELGEGPCLDAIRIQERTVVPDMATEKRWPRWAVAARERGVGSMLSFQLFARDGAAGALNLYAPTANVFDADAHHLGGLFASHAAITLYGARERAHLTRALQSRDEIGQAKGILMERFAMTADQAFALLLRSSQDTNVKLVTVARFLTQKAGARQDHDPLPHDPVRGRLRRPAAGR